MYNLGGKFLVHEFNNSLIKEEYVIKTKLDSPEIPQANELIEITNQVLGNLVCTYNLQETYLYGSDPWMGILSESAFESHSTYHHVKGIS